MPEKNRRELLKLLASAPLAAGFAFSEAQAQTAHDHARQAATAAAGKAAPYTPKFFTAHEWETVRVLVDIVIPRDERSGSATDALVPEFMDFILRDPLAEQAQLERNQTRMRGGLAWLDLECGRRFGGKSFVACSDAERTAVLDDIAYPRKAATERSHAVAFFNAFRDLTAAGFWSSRVGVKDIGYTGNTVVTEWKGCPPEVLAKLNL
jgi:gluconate 2-dehydrogenase gamma chain